jgi:subfamily B ATP-binding cassette protein MsbA
MDKSLIKLLPYTKPYKSHIIWNVFNVLYALFSTISMLTSFLYFFGKTRAVLTKPTYTGIGDIKQFGTDYMYYQISTLRQ